MNKIFDDCSQCVKKSIFWVISKNNGLYFRLCQYHYDYMSKIHDFQLIGRQEYERFYFIAALKELIQEYKITHDEVIGALNELIIKKVLDE